MCFEISLAAQPLLLINYYGFTFIPPTLQPLRRIPILLLLLQKGTGEQRQITGTELHCSTFRRRGSQIQLHFKRSTRQYTHVNKDLQQTIHDTFVTHCIRIRIRISYRKYGRVVGNDIMGQLLLPSLANDRSIIEVLALQSLLRAVVVRQLASNILGTSI